jgi:anti-sigma regulatory factor (Ser/Thr protein kinase)
LKGGLIRGKKIMQKEFKRQINSLKEIFIFIKSFIIEEQLNKDLVSPLNLVIEELFTNMVKYSSDNPNKILLELTRDSDRIMIILTDFDVDRFDIRQTTKYDTDQTVEKRPIGKVGLHLVKKYVDDINYMYWKRTSKITLIKYLGKKHA